MPGKKSLTPIRVGSVSLARYKLKDGRIMLVDRRADGRRWLRTFTDPGEAREEGEKRARELHNGGTESEALTSADRASFAQAKRDTAAFDVPIHVATGEWSEARKKINGHSFLEVIEAGVRALSRVKRPVPVVCAELMATKEQRDLNGRYKRGIESSFREFAKTFPDDIRMVKAAQIEKWLASFNVGPRRRDNILADIRHLFQFARLREYLPDSITEASKVVKLDHMSGTISIFTVSEMQLFLAHVKEAWLPYLAIGAFSGVRTEEICLAKDASRRKSALQWEDFDWDELEINIRAETAKTGVPRRCPILPNLCEWLAPWREKHAKGPVAPSRPDREVGNDGRLVKAINHLLKKDLSQEFHKIEWRHNALRHSYGSYRMAQIKNMQQLSYEMGNSLGMIKRHYHNPRPISEAKAWFSISPSIPANVTQLPLQFERSKS